MVEQLFKDILETQSVSGHVERMTYLIVEYARKFGADVKVDKGNVYVTKGKPTANGYPCIVSHTDTVHAIITDEHYSVGYDEKNQIIYAYDYSKRNFTGIGGDDKVGIYIALAAIRDFPSIKSCFFRDEEIGCVGSGEADLSFFSDCMYILQCDRRGNSDFVNSINGIDISSKDFQDDVSSIIKKYDYDFHVGGTTDVGKLTSMDVGISCANMSCGYYNPHSTDEIVDVHDVNVTKDMVYEIIGTLTKSYPHIAERPKTTLYKPSFGKNYYDYYDNWYDGYSKEDNKKVKVTHTKDNLSSGKYVSLDWYSDIPSNEDFAVMEFDDFYYHAILIMNGWRYCGNCVYSKTNNNITTYEELFKIDVVLEENKLNEGLLSEAFEFADYCCESKESMGFEQFDNCLSCGKQMNVDSMKANDGVCSKCFSNYNAPIF